MRILRTGFTFLALIAACALRANPTTGTTTRISRLPVTQANNQLISGAIRSRVSRTKSDMRSMATAIESYGVDWSVYPAHVVGGEFCKRVPKLGEKPVPSFRGNLLTTPIAYMTGFFLDPFEQAGQTFGYFQKTTKDQHGWILFSAGPDGKIDLDWDVYDPARDQPSIELAVHFYDPTNGTASGGDIVRVKQ